MANKVDLKLVEKLAMYGFTDAQLADSLDVSEVTINNWKADPEFSLVLKRGKLVADIQVAESLFKRATGFKLIETHEEIRTLPEGKEIKIERTIEKEISPDTTACIFWLKNRDRSNWRDKWEIEVSDNRSPYAHMSDEEFTEILNRKRLRERDKSGSSMANLIR